MKEIQNHYNDKQLLKASTFEGKVSSNHLLWMSPKKQAPMNIFSKNKDI